MEGFRTKKPAMVILMIENDETGSRNGSNPEQIRIQRRCFVMSVLNLLPMYTRDFGGWAGGDEEEEETDFELISTIRKDRVVLQFYNLD